VRPIVFDGSECWAVDGRIEQNMSVVETRTFRWMSGVTREDRKRNECVSGSILVVASIGPGQDEREWTEKIWGARDEERGNGSSNVRL